MPRTKKLTATAAPADGKKIGFADYKKMLAKSPRCTDPATDTYRRYHHVLQRAIEHGTRAVVDDAKKRLTMLDRAVNGYDSEICTKLKKSPEHRAYVGPHPKGQQCKPVFVARFPSTDYKALRVDEGEKKRKKREKH